MRCNRFSVEDDFTERIFGGEGEYSRNPHPDPENDTSENEEPTE